ncbi:MAG: uridine diphosphate-N-acetylglucosamine-binding protein YvcK, partial [Anaerolineales bacterium]
METEGRSRWTSRLRQLWLWIQPGLGVKRWLLLMIAGTALIGLGLAIVLLDYYRGHPDSTLLFYLSLQVLPRWLRALVLGGSGVALLLLAVVEINRSLLAPYMSPGRSLVEVVTEHRRLGRGPNIVAIGGGHGLATLLRGLKKHSTNLTAIVTMADDGGSSGRLRRSLGLPPPGDVRNCIAALSDDEKLLTQLFQYRFHEGEELEGHAFGNLFIAALAGVTGSFDRGLLEAGRILSIRGTVLPSTLADIALLADKTPLRDVQAVRIEGESRITGAPGKIRRVYLEPNDPSAYPLSIQAILNADMIIVGPGSLYTSILPNLLVPDITRAILA